MRTAFCLNGEWDFMPLYGHGPGFGLPAELVYEECKITVPSSWRGSYERPSGKIFGEITEHGYSPYEIYGYPKEWARADAGVLHRVFRLPDSMTGQETRIFLRLDGIMQKAAVYLNRRLLALWEDGYLPFLADITKWVKAGAEHDLHVVCGSFDKVALPSGQQKITGLAGSWFGSVARGIWQDVYLESRPDISLSDVAIRTSVRENRLEVDASVSHPFTKLDGTPFRLELTVREDGRQHASPILRAEAGADEWVLQEFTSFAAFRLDWADAKRWDPDRPFLYVLELLLMDGDLIIDRVEERFGFREIWTEGPRFILNGIPVNLRGDSWHFQGGLQQTKEYVRNWYRMCKEAGVNCVRLHAEPHPAYYLDIADEEGMLIVDETAIYGSGKSMLADHPDFIANCKAHVRRLVERDRNHPSVIMWSLQNEMRWVDGRDGYKQHIPSMIDSIRELDPTRPVIAEGDNRLLPKHLTEVESRHYNIDGTIAQWDRKVPLVFGEHGGWWYICPQNSSMYTGLAAYRSTDESVKGLAEKERLFVEYARRQGVTGISAFNFAHYFMRAMPDQDIPLQAAEPDTAFPKPKVIPRYSLTLNNGLLPEEYPAYRKNPAFDRMAASFKPATMIPAEYNGSFFNDNPVVRSFDVYNDTLHTRRIRIECKVRQEGRLIHEEHLEFEQEPAGRKTVTFTWISEPVEAVSSLHFHADMLHDNKPVHELDLSYKLYPSRYKTDPAAVGRPVAYVGGERDFRIIGTLVPECRHVSAEQIGLLSPDHLLVAGSKLEEADGQLEQALKRFVASGGRVLLLEQLHLSLGKLAISRQDFIRAHAGSYDHPVLLGLDNEDLMLWHEEVREEGPLPIIRAAFEKPVKGNFTMILECGSGDFGDGGDLWSPLLEYRSGKGLFIASQLELMDNFHQVPQACILLRNLLAYAGNTKTVSVNTGAIVQPGGKAEAFLRTLALRFDMLLEPSGQTLDAYGLIAAQPHLLSEPEAAAAIREYAQGGGKVVILPAEPGQENILSHLLKRDVAIREHETYHLEAEYSMPEVQGLSPVDLFGFDKVFLSPREAVNRPLALYSLEAAGTAALCTGVEGTAWKDYFLGQHTDEYSRVALVELNKEKERPPGTYVLEAESGEGLYVLSQLLLDPDNDKSIRLYTKLLANLGAVFDDGFLSSVKGDGEWAVEKVMAMPCRPYVDYEAMKAYYIDPEFSLNNLGEGLYGWMQKKERSGSGGTFHIGNPGGDRWFLSCFVHLLRPAGDSGDEAVNGQLQINASCAYEIYMNGRRVPEPERHIALQAGINRLIAIVHSPGEEIRFGMVFKNTDGTYMRNLQYRLTLDEVEPK
ncbi:glycoside hydrolase family 2 [Paenibacillus sp. N4]|uniref:glycoside hydrolase family 2 protein n=1 Tax=Paenibacillus vietnamensis TaxID=2590547 RepID=UPI001CD17FAB|nr:glycoside hydrolase family 2 TIM barrel-domain containing protein [Paenibacillus vietnamensis]MCA0753545.1 glycoside hydrolase family 2 [Paenibacillus vietnamensis]